MTMKLRTTLIPLVLAAAPLTGYWNASTASAAASVGVSVTTTAQVAVLPTAAGAALDADELAQLQQADQGASTLGAMRGGGLTNHELTIGVIVLAILVVLILI